MTEHLDANRIAADVIHRVFKDTARTLSTNVKDAVSKFLDVFRKDLSAYLSSTISRCCLIKTPIINRDRPTYFFDIYVHTKLTNKGKSLVDDDFIAKLPELKSVVVAGSAGSGKSMFMRYLFMALCENGFGRIPLFVELRNLNSIAKKDLLTFIYYSIVGPGAVITEEQFESGLRNGAFSLILDGFDEVDFDQRKAVEQQILSLREKYPELLMIISSRRDPDSRFESWTRFHVLYVEPMEERQIVELIKKVDYDKKIKSSFLKTLREGLFNTHKSFLSNPLLCLMMLVTFEQTGNIPDKRHIFYEHAFDALFFLHDSAKEGVYRRKTYANWPAPGLDDTDLSEAGPALELHRA